MIRRIGSLLLCVVMLFTMLPTAVFAAEDDGESIVINAAGQDGDTIVVGSQDEGGGEAQGDTLALSSHVEQAIARDYDQIIEVEVTNLSSQPVQYYLECENNYEDIYMNFVKSGSVDAPLTIQANETQTVELSVFAQNARRTNYQIRIFGKVTGGETVEMPLSFSCAAVDGTVEFRKGSVDENTLATEYTVTNAGDTEISDLTLSISGEAADYVRINPSVENYALGVGQSVKVKLVPDLFKMKEMKVSVIAGNLIAEGGGVGSTEISFDTQGKEITATTIGELAMMQDDNPYHGIEADLDTMDGGIGETAISELAEQYLKDGTGVDTAEEVDAVYDQLFDESGMFQISLESDFVYETEADVQETVPVELEIHAAVATQSETNKSAEGSYSYDENTGELTYTSVMYMTRAEYDEMIASFKRSVEQEFDIPSENESVALFSSVRSSDPDEEIAVEFSMKMLEEATEGTAFEYGFKFMDAIDTGVDAGKTISVLANPNYTDGEKVTYTALNGAKIYMRYWGGKALTGALTASLDGPGLIIGLFGNALIDYGLDKLTEAYEENVLGFGGAIYYDIYGRQCTNAGRVTSNFYLPDTDTSNVGIYETGRMYDGTPYGGNAGYADEQFGGDTYIHDRPVNYDYILNGHNVGNTQNNGLTSVSIVDLSDGAEYLKPGNNTIVRDYDTNAGHYSVVADTEITVLYPSDTPISYIGSPDTMEEVRLLPDFAVYWENILPAQTAIIGEENTVSVNLYNRGSMGGWADVTVTAGEETVYTQENLYLAAFSGETVSFEWTPATESTELTVILENKCVGVEERKADNNTATRTITARNRQVPQFGTIAPSEAVQNAVLYITADLTNTADLVSVSFDVNETSYSGDAVTLAETAAGAQATAKIRGLEPGAYTVTATAVYRTDAKTTGMLASSNHTMTVKAPDSVTFTVDATVSAPEFTVLRKSGSRFYSVDAGVTEDAGGSTYTLVKTADMANRAENYYLLTTCDGGVILTPIADLSSGTSLTLTDGKTVSIQGNAGETEVSGVYLYGIGGSDLSIRPRVTLSEDDRLIVQGADSVEMQISFTVDGMGSSANVEQGLNSQVSTINLGDFYRLYRFHCPDTTEYISYIDAQVYVETAQMVSILYGDTEYDENNKQVSLLIDGSYNLERLEDAVSVTAYLPVEDTLYAADLTQYSGTVTLSRTGYGQITYTCSAGTPDIGETMLKVGNYYNTFYLYGAPLYLPAGTYAIAVSYELNGKQLFHTETVTVTGGQTANVALPGTEESATAALTVNWPQWLADQGNMSYQVEAEDSYWYRNVNLERGEPVNMPAGTFDLNTYLYKRAQNGSGTAYSLNVEHQVTLEENQAVTLEIGSTFKGTVEANSSATVYPGATIYLEFADLKDSDGNELYSYRTSKAEQALRGTVTLVSTDDPAQRYEIEASTTSFYGSLSFELPKAVAPGTYTYAVTLSNGEAPEQPETEHSIVASAEPGGSIDPSGSVRVLEGGSQSFTIRPDNGYAIQEVLVDGVSQGAISSYSFDNVTEDHTITARFRAKTVEPDTGSSGTSSSGDYIAAVESGTGGRVTVSPGRADKGDTVTITVKPNEGYELDTLTVTDKSGDAVKVSYQGGNRYTFIMPGSQVTVEATFVKEGSQAAADLPFTDVAESDWYCDAVKYVYESGLMNGTSGTAFSPFLTTSRAMILTILARYDGVNTDTGATWYEAGAAWAVANGVSDGTNLEADLTREQLVTMLWRYIDSPVVEHDLADYPDSAAVSGWAVDAMIWAVDAGIITGNGAGELNPQGTATRAEVATILMRFVEYNK